MRREMMHLGFGTYIVKDDVIGIYDVDKKSTMKRMTSKTNAPFPNQVLNNLNARGCKSYVETPFHIYLCAYPVEVLLEEYAGTHTDEVDKLREMIDSEEYLTDVVNNKYARYRDLYSTKIAEAKKSALETVRKATAAKERREV